MTRVRILRGESIKVGDTQPHLRLKLLEDGDPFNLSGYNVTLTVQLANSETVVVDDPVTIEAPTRGIVTYAWDSGETTKPGTYEFELSATNGTEQITFPNSGTQTLYIEDRLG